MDTGPAHECEVAVAGENRYAMGDRERRDEQVERLDGGAAAPDLRTEFPSLLPEVRGLNQMMTTVQ
jgi:hypothetical protein